MIKDPQITLFDLTICLSDAADLISPALANHHKQVARAVTQSESANKYETIFGSHHG